MCPENDECALRCALRTTIFPEMLLIPESWWLPDAAMEVPQVPDIDP